MSLPTGWIIRPVALIDGDGDDVDRARAVITAHEDALGMPSEETRESVRAYLADPDCDRDHSLLVFDQNAAPRGFLLVEIDRLGEQVSFDAYSDPTADLMPTLVARGVERARQVAASAAGSWVARTGYYERDSASRRALDEAGFTVARHFLRMRVDLQAAPLPPLPNWPEGVTCGPVASEDLELVHAVLEESFADHWNHTARSFDDWWQAVSTPEEFHDPALWWLVRVDGEPAAILIGTLSRAHEGDGYVRALGVRRAFRGRGLARGLLRVHFADSAARGFHGVQLGVDATNPTGAVALYESVGMVPVRHIVAVSLVLSHP